MFEIAEVTPALLAQLGAELNGCDFSHSSQTAFLAERLSCDVQAAPGNGKTTLLVAKLALLSRTWRTQRTGVCVISHTNAARTEVEDQLAGHAHASRFLAYPHFIGTVTAFINQFIALPYLRGLGWTVRQIDDDAFRAEALRRYPSWSVLRNLATRQNNPIKGKIEGWVSELDLSPDFTCPAGESFDRVQVVTKKGQWGPHTDCGVALERLKASMVKSGMYRYADMTALAWRALRTTPHLADRLRARFPLVILDEAQDTTGEQLKMLEFLFKGSSSAFQRLGDQNQTLYENDTLGPADYWNAGGGAIPLNTTRRFGGDIASFASRLTARSKQTITSEKERPNCRVLILFDQMSVQSVIGVYAEEARSHWGEEHQGRDIWAVASRHSVAGHAKGAWKPKTLVDYHPHYRSEAGARPKANLLCRQMQKASLHHAAGRPTVDVLDFLSAGLAALLRIYQINGLNNRVPTPQSVWAILAQRDLTLPLKLRRAFRDHVLLGNAPWGKEAWLAFLEVVLLSIGDPPADAKDAITAFLDYVGDQRVELTQPGDQSSKEANYKGLTVKLGSIHSVKGKTVDGILVVESEVWKGAAAGQQCMDMEAVLPQAFGLEDRTFAGVDLVAATNVFVAITRPREVLALAVRRSAVSPELISAATTQGWKVIDLTDRA
jgi:hypothetical protein